MRYRIHTGAALRQGGPQKGEWSMKKKPSVIIKGKKGQQLNQREAKLINDCAVEGLLLFDSEIKGNTVKLCYNIDGLVPLDEFLKMSTMNKRLFVILLRNVVLALKGVEDNHFSKNLIDWSLKSAYVDPSSWHVYFLYIPLQPYETSGMLKTFLLDFISNCAFDPNDDTQYVQRLVKEVNGGVTYTTYMLERMCDQISEELAILKSDKQDHILCTFCKSKLNADEDSCPFCGTRVRNGGLPRKKNVYSDSKEPMPMPSLQAAPKLEEPRSEARGAICVNEDGNGVVTVFRSARNSVQSVWLEDCDHMGKIPVTKFPFRIGKMEGVTDYRICRNTVSRKHADIMKEQGGYFIVDLGSTNGTFLNGRRLQPGVKERLADGLHITFADAEFKIHID